VKFYLSLVMRRIHWILLFLIAGTAIGVTLSRTLPAVYVSRATLLVETSQIPSSLAQSTVQIGAIEQLQIIQQRIMTRDNLIDMANRLKIYAQPGVPSEPMSPDAIVADLRDRISISTTGGSTPRGPQQATIVTISFEAPTPNLAAAVVNEVVTKVLDENVAIRTEVAQATLKFFSDEVDRLELSLSKKEAEILAFQEANIDALPDSLDFRRTQQATEQARLQQIERDLATLRDRRNSLVGIYQKTGDVGAATPSASMTPEQRALQQLKDQLAQATAVLSPDNPRVKMLQAQVAVAEQKVAEQAAAGLGQGGQPLSPYEVQLADIDSQIQALVLQRDQAQATLDGLQKSIEATPGNSVTMATLQRDYDNLKAQYNQAVSAKAQAQTGETMEALAKAQRISVIDQPVAPMAPERPNRKLIAAGGVAGGLGAGLALVLLLELLNTRVRRAADLTAKLGINAFGTVPLIRTRAEMRRRRTGLGLAVLAVLIAVPAALWYVNTYVTPLDLLLNNLLDRFGLASLAMPRTIG